MRTSVSSFLVLSLLATPLAAQQPAGNGDGSGLASAVGSITSEDFRRRIGVIAHDSMQGRDTPSPGLDKTAEWIRGEFERFGLQGGADDGSFMQRYEILHVAPDLEQSRVRIAEGGELRFGEDLGFPFGAGRSGDFTGELVLISGSRDWQEALAGADLRGRHVVAVFEGTSARAQVERRIIRTLLGSGAASIWTTVSRTDEEWKRDVSLQAQASQVSIPWNESERPTMVSIRDEALATVLGGSPTTIDDARGRSEQPLTITELPVTATLSVRNRVLQEASAPNVVAVLEGSDPQLRSEYVVFSAHMDHVGTGRPNEAGDSIYNGADDDASGTTAVVELAEAFSMLPQAPRRSMVFLLVSGEEKGLWGSRYFADHGPLEASAMVANLNLDMVGRNWDDTIVVIGKEHSDLGSTLTHVNEAHPELDMTAIDDLWPEESFYTRSDHFNFARLGVPVLFFFNGTHDDYHRPSDEVDLIDTEKASRIARLVFYLGLEVASKDERPQWNPDSYRRIVSPDR